LKTLEFQKRICSLDVELEYGSDDDNEITASSTVEADDILKTPDLIPESTRIVQLYFSLFFLPDFVKNNKCLF
jgi:hypothetical protein